MLRSLTRLVERGLGTRNLSLSKLDEFMEWAWNGGGAATWSGATVTNKTALQLDAVWGCISVRAGSLSQLPLITYRVDPQTNSKDRARDHYLYRALRYHVNPYLTAARWKKLCETWICIDGNAYNYLEVNGRGQVMAIWPWHYSRVEVDFKSGEPVYKYRKDDGKYIEQPWFNILHLRGDLSTDGFFGLSPISYHRETIGHAIAVRRHGATFFKNGARPLGYLKAPAGQGAPDPNQVEKIRAAWNEAHGGLDNAHKIAILGNGLEYKETGISQVDAQYLETDLASVPKICRIYGVPPHKVFDLSRSTNNNIEHQDIEWRMDYQGPRIADWEDELNNALLSDREAETIHVEFLVNALMRADSKSRAEYYSKALGGAPWMVQNEVRGTESLNRMESDDADTFPVTNNAPGPSRAAQPTE